MNVGVTLQLWYWSGVFFWWAREPYTCVWPLSFLLLSSPDSWLSAVCTFALFASLQKVTLHHALYFVRCDVSHLDDCNAFDATRWGHDKTTYIDFQLVKDGNDRTLSELIGSNLSGSRLDRNEREYDQKKPYYQTYWCQYPLHVVFNEPEIVAGYKVIAANTTKEIFVWTLHKP